MFARKTIGPTLMNLKTNPMKKSIIATLGMMAAVGAVHAQNSSGLNLIPIRSRPYKIQTTKNGKKIKVYK